ncbi:extensin-like [Penaeus monodon]|uniref:extensin-like n=1 Tax=Penaeus monodon TaxID=6687 RepID=UPI0018A77795|nr:extensin-like [Penaeus monodon]
MGPAKSQGQYDYPSPGHRGPDQGAVPGASSAASRALFPRGNRPPPQGTGPTAARDKAPPAHDNGHTLDRVVKAAPPPRNHERSTQPPPSYNLYRLYRPPLTPPSPRPQQRHGPRCEPVPRRHHARHHASTSPTMLRASVLDEERGGRRNSSPSTWSPLPPLYYPLNHHKSPTVTLSTSRSDLKAKQHKTSRTRTFHYRTPEKETRKSTRGTPNIPKLYKALNVPLPTELSGGQSYNPRNSSQSTDVVLKLKCVFKQKQYKSDQAVLDEQTHQQGPKRQPSCYYHIKNRTINAQFSPVVTLEESK